MKSGILMSIGFTVGLVAAVWGASEVWFGIDQVEIGFHGGFALLLGAIGSLLLGGSLMMLLFFSARKGYDEKVFSADDEPEWD